MGRLWIAFEFISLTRFQQALFFWTGIVGCCELLLNLYLWQDSNRTDFERKLLSGVVNCFWIYIFDKIPTGACRTGTIPVSLWIAFEFISLTRFQQASCVTSLSINCCELLLNLYLWQDSNRIRCDVVFAKLLWIAFEFISLTRFQQATLQIFRSNKVVNCFWIYIFDKIPTGILRNIIVNQLLWIAFEFISLTRFQQECWRLRN